MQRGDWPSFCSRSEMSQTFPRTCYGSTTPDIDPDFTIRPRSGSTRSFGSAAFNFLFTPRASLSTLLPSSSSLRQPAGRDYQAWAAGSANEAFPLLISHGSARSPRLGPGVSEGIGAVDACTCLHTCAHVREPLPRPPSQPASHPLPAP